MSDAYLSQLPENEFVPNVVIFYAGEYFAIREPDSGLAMNPKYVGLVGRISINPTSIDPQRPSTTVNSSSFTLIDRNHEVSKLFLNQNGFRTGEKVRMWIGRSFTGMDFSEYLEMPETYLNKVQKAEATYNFSTVEEKDRLNIGIFNIKSKLAVSILANTTTITLQSIPSNLPSIGYGKIGDEYFSWNAISDNNLVGCVRGEFGSIPSDHETGEDFFNIYDISPTNCIDLLLQMLTLS